MIDDLFPWVFGVMMAFAALLMVGIMVVML